MFDALLDNEIININFVQKIEGPKPEYKCPICNAIVIPKLGDVNKHHFAHKANQDSSCVDDMLYMSMWDAKHYVKENEWRENWISYIQANINCKSKYRFANKCMVDIYIPATKMVIMFVPYGCFKNTQQNFDNDFFKRQCELLNTIDAVERIVWVWRLMGYSKDGSLVEKYRFNRITPYCTKTYKLQRTKVLCYKECCASMRVKIDLFFDFDNDRIEKLQWSPLRENQTTHNTSMNDLKNMATFPMMQNRMDFINYCTGNHVLFKYPYTEIVPCGLLKDSIEGRKAEHYDFKGGSFYKFEGLNYWVALRKEYLDEI